MILNEDGIIDWGAIQSADGYELEITINGSVTATIQEVQSQCELTRYIDEGKFDGITKYSDVISVKVLIKSIGKIPNKIDSITIEKNWTNLH